MLALILVACLPLAAAVLWVIGGVLADKAADAEWRAIDAAPRQRRADIAAALSLEVRRRQDKQAVSTLPPL